MLEEKAENVDSKLNEILAALTKLSLNSVKLPDDTPKIVCDDTNVPKLRSKALLDKLPVNTLNIECKGPAIQQRKSVWEDKNKLESLKSQKNVLVVKSDSEGSDSAEMKDEIEKIVVENKFAMKNSYHNKSGDSVLVCDTAEECTRLKSVVQATNKAIKMSTPGPNRPI